MYRRYFIGFLLGFIGLATPVMWFNWYVDPFCFFERNTVGMYFHTERQCKAMMVQQREHDALIIGNSRPAWIGASPLLPDKVLNVSFSGAEIEEVYAFLDKYLKPNTQVLIGIDFEMMYSARNDLEDGGQTGEDFRYTPLEYLENLLGWEVISKSIAVYFYRDVFLPSIPLGEIGERIPRPGQSEADRRSQGYIAPYDTEGDKSKMLAGSDAVQKRFDVLLRLKQLLEARAADYVVFTNPVFPARRAAFREHYPQAFAALQGHPDKLANIFERFVDFSLDGSFQERDFRDWSHFYPSVAERMLVRLVE